MTQNTAAHDKDQIKSFVEDKLKYSIKKLPIFVCYSSKVGQEISFSYMVIVPLMTFIVSFTIYYIPAPR